MMKLEQIPPTAGDNATTAHVILRLDTASRVELTVDDNGNVALYCYTGTETDVEQEPDIIYDNEGDGPYFRQREREHA